MGRDRAAYMREYRRRKPKVSFDEAIRTQNWAEAAKYPSYDEGAPFRARIAELEEEVRHLKAELAKRPLRTHTGHRDGNPGAASDRFNTRPFTPAPKVKK